MTQPDRTPREAIIQQIRDMLDDEAGRDFVECAVTYWSEKITERAKQNPLWLNAPGMKEQLAFAELILA